MARTLQHGQCRGSTSCLLAGYTIRSRCLTPYRNNASRHISAASHRTYGARLQSKAQSIRTKKNQVAPMMCAQSKTGESQLERRDITPLHIAAQKGDLQAAQSLLAHGADVNAKESEDEALRVWGWTPLHHAALHSHVDMVKLLLSHGADVGATDSEGATPLAMTVSRNHMSHSELLLSEGLVCQSTYQEDETFGQDTVNNPPMAEYMKGAPVEDWRPLKHVVHKNQADVVSLLLAHGADPVGVHAGAPNPVDLVILDDNLGMIKLLCTRKHDSSQRNPKYLYRAILSNQADIVEHALSLNLNAAEIDKGYSLLHAAVARPDILQNRLCLEEQALGITIHKPLAELEDLLQAANAEQLRVVQSLLAHGADVNAAKFVPQHDGQDTTMQSWNARELGWTALHLAALKQSPAVVELLCKHGASPNATNNKGRTPLHHAAYANDAETIKVLLRCGADAKAVDSQSQTVLHSAASQDFSKQLDHVNQAQYRQPIGGAFPHRPSWKVEDLKSVSLTYQQTVEALVAHGADASACNFQGLTALHCAARDKNLEMVKTLLGYGVDVNARALQGWTPLHYAVHGRYLEMARVLIDAGADVNAKDEKGCSPLHGCYQTYIRENMNYNPRLCQGYVPLRRAAQLAAAHLADLLLAHGAQPAPG